MCVCVIYNLQIFVRLCVVFSPRDMDAQVSRQLYRDGYHSDLF